MISAMKKRISNNKGLTLIELIIVIAIIGILAVIGITQFSGMTSDARIKADTSTAAEVASAAKMYEAETGEKTNDISDLVPKYIEKVPESQVAKSEGAEGDDLKFELVMSEIVNEGEDDEETLYDIKVNANGDQFYPSYVNN